MTQNIERDKAITGQSPDQIHSWASLNKVLSQCLEIYFQPTVTGNKIFLLNCVWFIFNVCVVQWFSSPVLEAHCPACFGWFPAPTHLIQMISSLLSHYRA
ncbi:Hypothetical predicted protein [Xyrichtys novacula]|uniref:Uncharacterized protein n=1 Tax=Xyrichtys novacula TaxID=13765 RepID=A0AAV1EW96_XYRNO|nr:Hypothetical predicted protein [Xyrichtys novacula]